MGLSRLFDIATIVVLGGIIGNLVINPKGTAAIFQGVTNLWSVSMQAVSPGAHSG